MSEPTRPLAPKRVVYLLKKFPRLSETFVLNEILGMEAMGVEVVIYSLWKPNDGRFHADLSRLKARVNYMPESLLINGWEFASAVFSVVMDRPGRALRSLGKALVSLRPHAVKRWCQGAWLAHRLRDEPQTGIHCHFALSASTVALHVHRLNGNPFTFTAHAKDIFLRSTNRSHFREKVNESGGVITVTDHNRDFILRNLAPGADEKVRRIHNGVDLERFVPPAFEFREPGRLLAVARLVEKKGLDTLLDACALLRKRDVDFSLHIVGTGAQRRALKIKAKALELSDSVTFLGAVPHETVRKEMRRCVLSVAPCREAQDGNLDALPTSLLEALATGTPSVATNVSGLPEIIEDGREGVLIPPDNAQALADAINALLCDGARRAEMGANARAKAKRLFNQKERVTDIARTLAVCHAPPVPIAGPLRVGYVLTMFPRLSETFVLREVLALEGQGASVTVFSQKPPLESKRHAEASHVRAETITLSPWWIEFHLHLFAHLWALATRPGRYLNLIKMLAQRFNRPNIKKWWRCARIAREVERRRIEHLHCHFMTGNARLIEFTTMLVNVSHSITAHAKDIYASGLSESKVRRRLKQAAFVVTISDFNMKHLLGKQPEARLEMIPNAIDPTEFEFTARQEHVGPLRVLSVGRLIEKKGFAQLIDAAASLYTRGMEIEVRIVGDGDLHGALSQQISALAMNGMVKLMGSRSQDELRGEFAWADIMAVPSIEARDGDIDGMPVVVLEAMALGVPVIASRISGIPEVVRDGESGVLVPPDDVEALAEAMANVRPPSLNDLALAARRQIEQEYSTEPCVRRLHGLMREAAGRSTE